MAPRCCAVFNVGWSGHVNVTLPVVQGLVADGWSVVYYCYGAMREKIEATGAEYREYYANFDTGHHNLGKALPLCAQPAAVALLPDLLEQMRALQPTVIFYDFFAVWGRYLGQILGVKTVCSLSAPIMEQSPLPLASKGFQATAINHSAIQTLKEVYSVDTAVEDCFITHSPDLNVAYTSEGYQGQPDCIGPILFAGALISPRPISEAERAYVAKCTALRESGCRLVLLSMGTAVRNSEEFFTTCYQALGPMEADRVHVMMATGRAQGGELTGASSSQQAPSNFHCLSPFVPQLECLKLAAAFVTHGGMNSVQEALCHDTPMVVIPGFGDQPWNGRRLETLGAGVVCERSTLTPESLAAAVRRVLNEAAYAAQAKAMGEGVRACRGVEAIVEAVGTL